jgi:hypothetical protein
MILCGLLSAAFAILAWSAVSGKSYTPDEPGHALVGYFMRYQDDFRFWCNNPPLWEYWIALPDPHNAIDFDPASDEYHYVDTGVPPAYWSHRVPLWLMRRGRMMSLILGVALALLIGRWAWDLGGTASSVAATFFYCFDPNFLGHAPILKNDVGCSLFYLATAYAAWKAGENLTIRRAFAVAVLAWITIMVKFSGLVLGPVLIVLFGYRALCGGDWTVLGRQIVRRRQKLAAAGAIWLLALIVTFAGTWASYGFRYSAGPEGTDFVTSGLMKWFRTYALTSELHRDPTPAEIAAWQPPLATRLILAANERHLIPEAFAIGIVFTEFWNQGQEMAYLNGHNYQGGELRYFPLAFIYKEPLTTIACAAAAMATGISLLARGRLAGAENRWAAICLAIPAAIYAVAAITAQMNIGYRHVFPALPFLFIAIGLAAGRAWEARTGKCVVLIAAALLAIETLSAFPDFIAFFNVAFSRHRMELLDDSNLDWGQDLPALAGWQRAHPDQNLYLDYFGQSDPASFGVNAIALNRGGVPPLKTPAVAAVSVTMIQTGGWNQAALARLGVDPRSKPREILGGTICLFPVQLSPAAIHQGTTN